jgi:hypothetical protein
MAINFANYLAHPTESYGPGDVFGGFESGYKAARLPYQEQQKEEQTRQLIEQLMHGNQKAGLENQYLPTKLQQEEQGRGYTNETARLNLEALPQEIKDEILRRALENQKRQIEVDYGPRLNEALLNQRNSKAAGSPEKSSVAYKNLVAAGFTPGTPEFENAMRHVLNVPSGKEYDHPLAIDTQGMTGTEKVRFRDEMNSEISKGDAAVDAIHDAKEMLKILKDNPEMSEWYTTDLFDPAAKASTYARLKRILTDKKDLAELEKFNKLSADLVLRQTALEGGKGGATDQYMQMVSASKANPHYTNNANEFVLNNMIKKYSGRAQYVKDARAAKLKKQILLWDPDYYNNKNEHEKEAEKEANVTTPENFDASKWKVIG